LAERQKDHILFQMALKKHPEMPAVPAILDYAKTPEDRQVLQLLLRRRTWAVPFFAPPGLPPSVCRRCEPRSCKPCAIPPS